MIGSVTTSRATATILTATTLATTINNNNNNNTNYNNNNNNNCIFKERQINIYWPNLNPIWTATKERTTTAKWTTTTSTTTTTKNLNMIILRAVLKFLTLSWFTKYMFWGKLKVRIFISNEDKITRNTGLIESHKSSH